MRPIPDHNRGHLLIADDQPEVLCALKLLLGPQGYHIQIARDPSTVLELCEHHVFDAIVIDLNFHAGVVSGDDGLLLLPKIRAVDPTVSILAMTAWGNIDMAVDAIHRGASDFIQKPWDDFRLLTIIHTQVDFARSRRDNARMAGENNLLRFANHRESVIGTSAAIRNTLHLAEQIAGSDANVLILGENGTGKGLIAAVIHSLSNRRQASMITLNAGGLADGTLDSELFGHVRGAFTDAKTDRLGRFEAADSGTLFLDEIANLPPSHQAKLLRVLSTGEFERVGSSRTLHADVRIISATNADIYAEVSAGRFREDLLFRLNTVEITLPSLRDRREDIPALAEHFLRIFAHRYRKAVSAFDSASLDALMNHAWPGNVRELEHVVERAVLLTTTEHIALRDLNLRCLATLNLDDMTLEQIDDVFIRKAMRRHGTVSNAAEALGLSRPALYRRLRDIQKRN